MDNLRSIVQQDAEEGGRVNMVAWRYLDKNFAVKKALRDYQRMKQIIEITPDEIKAAYVDMADPRTPSLSPAPSAHNPLAGENRLTAKIDEVDVMRERYREAKDYLKWFEPAWNMLAEEEQMILCEFYMSGSFKSGATSRLHSLSGYSERKIDRMRGDTLHQLSVLLYGQ